MMRSRFPALVAKNHADMKWTKFLYRQLCEREPGAVLGALLRGETLPDPRFDVTTTLCRLRDLFSRHRGWTARRPDPCLRCVM